MIVTEALVRWFIFSVVFALLPVISKALVLFTGLMTTRNTLDPQEAAKLTLADVLARTCGDGELLLVATAIAAAGIGEIAASRSMNRRLARVVVTGSLLIIVTLSSLWYAIIVGTTDALNRQLVAQGSLIVWLSAVATASVSVLLSALEEEA